MKVHQRQPESKKNIIVAFEGNDDINSTKGEDHYRRRKGGNSALVNIKNPEAKPTYSKQSFLKNRHNKMQLKNLLKPAFVKVGIKLKQSHGDVNVMICKTTFTMSV